MTRVNKYVPMTLLAFFLVFAPSGFAQQSSTAPIGAQPLMSEGHPAGPETTAERHELFQMVAKAPMSFEANQGQTDKRVKFLSRGAGYTLFLTAGGAVMALQNVAPAASPTASQSSVSSSGELVLGGPLAQASQSRPGETILNLRVVDANPHARVSGANKQDAKSNYFIGNDPKKWHTHVPNYGRVQYAGVYPGVDLVY